jgi:hypothetical protein
MVAALLIVSLFGVTDSAIIPDLSVPALFILMILSHKDIESETEHGKERLRWTDFDSKRMPHRDECKHTYSLTHILSCWFKRKIRVPSHHLWHLFVFLPKIQLLARWCASIQHELRILMMYMSVLLLLGSTPFFK